MATLIAFAIIHLPPTTHERHFGIYLGEEAAKQGAWVVHYSTSYVFDSTKQGVYTEDDHTNRKVSMAGPRRPVRPRYSKVGFDT